MDEIEDLVNKLGSAYMNTIRSKYQAARVTGRGDNYWRITCKETGQVTNVGVIVQKVKNED